MIREIGVDVQASIASKGCPFPVVNGPELRPTGTFGRERIVIEHDPAGDSFTSRHQTDTNPRTRLTRNIGVKVTIYAQDANKGATYWEHVRRAEHVLDMVLIALDITAKVRKNLAVFRSGKLVYPEDFKAHSETMGGAVYELLLTFDRGVADRRWDGSGLTTATISPQMVGGPDLTFSASAHTIARSFGSWLDDRFAVGQVVIVSGTVSNNVTKTITALSDLVMTFAVGLVNEGPVAATVTGNGVLLNSTTQATGFTEGGGTGTETACGNGGT